MNLLKNELKNIKAACNILQDGGVLLCPTDTVYGLLCDCENFEAIQKIYEIKNRDVAKKIAIFTPSINHLNNFCDISQWQKEILTNNLPGGFTFILKIKNESEFSLKRNFNYESVGIRMPDNSFISALLKKFNKPICATSANISGNQASSVFTKIDKSILSKCDLIIRDECNKEKESSCVIDIQEGKCNIIRNASYIDKLKNSKHT